MNTPPARPLPKMVVTEDGRKMELASDKTIRIFQSRPPRPPMHTYSAEFLRGKGFNDEGITVMLRAYQAAQDLRDIQRDVLEQYHARGYAYIEIPRDYPGVAVVDEELRVMAMELNQSIN